MCIPDWIILAIHVAKLTETTPNQDFPHPSSYPPTIQQPTHPSIHLCSTGETTTLTCYVISNFPKVHLKLQPSLGSKHPSVLSLGLSANAHP